MIKTLLKCPSILQYKSLSKLTLWEIFLDLSLTKYNIFLNANI